MQDADFLLLILSSPSGAGKTTLTRKLLDCFGDLRFSVSHTTRKPRANEIDGRDYHFVDRATFERMVDDELFLEWAEVHGNLYGTTRGEIDRARAEGYRGMMFDIDYQGARQIRAALPEVIGVCILPPSMAELERRLRGAPARRRRWCRRLPRLAARDRALRPLRLRAGERRAGEGLRDAPGHRARRARATRAQGGSAETLLRHDRIEKTKRGEPRS